MSRLFGVFIILIAVCTAAGCFSPVGSINGSDTIDLLWAVPERLEFTAGNRFIPNRDVKVFALYEGVVKSIGMDLVEIGIADATGADDLKEVKYDEGCILEKMGKKLIVLKYGGLSTSYYIDVLEATSPPPGDGSIPIIDIEWDIPEEPEKR